jgi:hypothetical protein
MSPRDFLAICNLKKMFEIYLISEKIGIMYCK